MKFETYKIADISTKYITAADGQLLSQQDAPNHVASIDAFSIGDEPPGDIYAVLQDEASFQDQLNATKAFGFSESFLNILKALHKQGIPYVRFDADGGEVEGDLPMFEW